MDNLIIKNSKTIDDLYLVYSIEKVYRIFYRGKEVFNELDYNIVADYFNKLEIDIAKMFEKWED